MTDKISGYYIEFDDETTCYLDTFDGSNMTVNMSIEGLMSLLEKISTCKQYVIYEVHAFERHDIVFQYPIVEK